MPYYVVARVDVIDEAAYGTYADRAVALIERFGGRFLVRGSPIEHIEGSGPDHLVIIEFPDRDAANALYMSDEYMDILPMGMRASARDVFAAWGVDEDVEWERPGREGDVNLPQRRRKARERGEGEAKRGVKSLSDWRQKAPSPANTPQPTPLTSPRLSDDDT